MLLCELRLSLLASFFPIKLYIQSNEIKDRILYAIIAILMPLLHNSERTSSSKNNVVDWIGAARSTRRRENKLTFFFSFLFCSADYHHQRVSLPLYLHQLASHSPSSSLSLLFLSDMSSLLLAACLSSVCNACLLLLLESTR